MNNYKNMSDEEIKEQLEWSDHHEFSYEYSIWAFEKIKQLKKQKDDIVEYISKHCVNEKISKQVGYKCYTMADTNELEKIMRMLGEIE